jgi:hypothetical protein
MQSEFCGRILEKHEGQIPRKWIKSYSKWAEKFVVNSTGLQGLGFSENGHGEMNLIKLAYVMVDWHIVWREILESLS